jgi:signal transduction histidine kinase
MEDLRTLSQGIRPALLMERGLGAALEELGRRSTVPVLLDLRLTGAVPSDIEAAAYFVASEALANVGKHSHASRVALSAVTEGSELHLQVTDDGLGGANADLGSGLRGLDDRVEAVGGSLDIYSPAGNGTRLTVVLPCA